MTVTRLSWTKLETLANNEIDRVNGPTNAQADLRLFGKSESDVRVTLYRDHHAWCPYCQKVWLWLEEKQIPYRIKKVTMFCYGEKESWYKRIVPSGMLPALELDGRVITESDDILLALEQVFGTLGYGMEDDKVIPLRRLERLLFKAWCSWRWKADLLIVALKVIFILMLMICHHKWGVVGQMGNRKRKAISYRWIMGLGLGCLM
jgi:glutathione S-transferase